MTDKNKKFILWFDELGIEDVGLVGGKNASLGEMHRNLTKKGVNVPNGFAVTAYAYDYLLEKGGVKDKIKKVLEDLDTHDVNNLAERGQKARDLIRSCQFPEKLFSEILDAYNKLCKEYGKDTDVAVRSSATAEDLPDASFAGQQESYLNIRGKHDLMDSCKKCFASLFTNRAISYREDKGFNHFDVSLSIGIQKMVRSDLASSGVIFTIDTETGFKDVVYITGIYGLGENIVQGVVNPDEFYVFKTTLKKGFKPIIMKHFGKKRIKMVYSEEGLKHTTKNIPVKRIEMKNFVINNEEILKLAEWACIIEDHYSKKAGKYKPMDIEWAKDGKDNKLYIVQARPETVQSRKNVNVLEEYKLVEKGNLITKGKNVGNKIGQGKANIIIETKDISKFKKGEVLVTKITDPDWEPIMKVASAIVTDKGGRTSHAAIVSRELGIPCVVGTNDATVKINQGQEITASCASSVGGLVYDGLVKFKVNKTDITNLKTPKTNIMINLGNPDLAFETSFLPNSGVGLARMEFIINESIKIHPKALIHYDELKDTSAKARISELTFNYKDKKEYFIDKLAMGVGRIGAAFYPKDVVIRLSDFKSNEYANLIGGKEFEPIEENPMIGWRGASRYYDKKFEEAFVLECKAMKKVRSEFGLTNIKLMVPFCRTVDEGKKVIKIMSEHGLKSGVNGLEIYVMCEIPANVILADEFADIFDGFSIGSNDLTQLSLGLDRDSELVSHLFDERNSAVKKLISSVIKVAKKRKKKIGICGDGPSSLPGFAKFLVEEGIDSMSLTPDVVVKTTLAVLEEEKKLKK